MKVTTGFDALHSKCQWNEFYTQAWDWIIDFATYDTQLASELRSFQLKFPAKSFCREFVIV